MCSPATSRGEQQRYRRKQRNNLNRESKGIIHGTRMDFESGFTSRMGSNRESRRNKWNSSTIKGPNAHLISEPMCTWDLLYDRVDSRHSRLWFRAQDGRGIDNSFRKQNRPRTRTSAMLGMHRLSENLESKRNCGFQTTHLTLTGMSELLQTRYKPHGNDRHTRFAH